MDGASRSSEWVDGGHPLLAGLHTATTGLTQAAGAGRDRVSLLSDEDTRAGLDAVAAAEARLVAIRAALLAHADVRGLKDQLKAHSTATWLAHTSRITGASAREHVKAAELLDAHPEAGDLLAAGACTWVHARVVATTLGAIDTLGTVDAPTRAKAVEFLTGQARTLDPVSLSVAARALVEALTTTPDVDNPAEQAAVERQAAEKPAGRFIQIFHDPDGTSSGRWKGLDPDATAAIETFFHHASLDDDQKEDSPWEQPAPGSSGQDDDPCRDRRTRAQRRLDAFARLARHALHYDTDLPGDAGGRRPVLSIACDYNTLTRQLTHGVLDTGVRIPAHTLRRLACGADLLPAIMDGPSAVLNLGRARRLFSTAQRRALELRDRGCTFPGCHQPARACEAHHQDHWEHGGPTDLRNGCLLCDHHHDQAHRQDWHSRLSPTNGHVEWQPPRTLDRTQQWRQHHRYTLDTIRRR
jgi:hypothetical protein